MIDAIWRKGVFLAGDIRRLSHWPFLTWAKDEHKVSYEEALGALPLIRYGDVGLHRDRGYLSNLAIPGFMKHAWIHVLDANVDRNLYGPVDEYYQIVEAISEGVVCRSPLYAMRSDYVIVLEPKSIGRYFVSSTMPEIADRMSSERADEFRKGACLKARRMVGMPYDHRFEFNIDEELKYYQTTGDRMSSFPRNYLQAAANQFRRYDIAFTCTELVAYAWWHLREQLGIERRTKYGKRVILADDFINENWRIRWASESVTVDVAASMGLHEEGIEMVRGFRR